MVIKTINSVVILVLTIIILLSVFAGLFPEIERTGDAVEATNAPLSTLFRGTGVVVLLIAVGWFLSVIDVALFPKPK